MKTTIKKMLSRLKLNKKDNVFEAAISQWDFENEEALTGLAFSDKEILELDQANLLKEDVFNVLYNYVCIELGAELAKEMAEITIARIKNTANYLKEKEDVIIPKKDRTKLKKVVRKKK